MSHSGFSKRLLLFFERAGLRLLAKPGRHRLSRQNAVASRGPRNTYDRPQKGRSSPFFAIAPSGSPASAVAPSLTSPEGSKIGPEYLVHSRCTGPDGPSVRPAPPRPTHARPERKAARRVRPLPCATGYNRHVRPHHLSSGPTVPTCREVASEAGRATELSGKGPGHPDGSGLLRALLSARSPQAERPSSQAPAG